MTQQSIKNSARLFLFLIMYILLMMKCIWKGRNLETLHFTSLDAELTLNRHMFQGFCWFKGSFSSPLSPRCWIWLCISIKLYIYQGSDRSRALLVPIFPDHSFSHTPHTHWHRGIIFPTQLLVATETDWLEHIVPEGPHDISSWRRRLSHRLKRE